MISHDFKEERGPACNRLPWRGLFVPRICVVWLHVRVLIIVLKEALQARGRGLFGVAYLVGNDYLHQAERLA